MGGYQKWGKKYPRLSSCCKSCEGECPGPFGVNLVNVGQAAFRENREVESLVSEVRAIDTRQQISITVALKSLSDKITDNHF